MRLLLWLLLGVAAAHAILNVHLVCHTHDDVGWLKTVDESMRELDWADGVMIGREAYHRPMVLGEIMQALADAEGTSYRMPTVGEILARMAEYAEYELTRGERLPAITRHLLGQAGLNADEADSGAVERRRAEADGSGAG